MEIGLCHSPSYIGIVCENFHLNRFCSFCLIEPQTDRQKKEHHLIFLIVRMQKMKKKNHLIYQGWIISFLIRTVRTPCKTTTYSANCSLVSVETVCNHNLIEKKGRTIYQRSVHQQTRKTLYIKKLLDTLRMIFSGINCIFQSQETEHPKYNTNYLLSRQKATGFCGIHRER